MSRPVNQAGRDLITEFEGVRLVRYVDIAGNVTIGVGHKVQPGEDIPDEITQEQCNDLFEKDLSNASDTVGKYITVTLSDNQWAALASLVFNLGSAPLTHSLGRFIESGNYTAAADQFERWILAGGKVSEGLVRRRDAERSLFLNPDNA